MDNGQKQIKPSKEEFGEYCRCGKKFGEHRATHVVEPSKKCGWCKAELPGTEKYYMQFGNCCESCRGKFARYHK